MQSNNKVMQNHGGNRGDGWKRESGIANENYIDKRYVYIYIYKYVSSQGFWARGENG